MDKIKPAIVPGVLAFVGVRAAGMFAPASTTGQLVGGIVGAIAGIVIARSL